jgi:hypothetical protein
VEDVQRLMDDTAEAKAYQAELAAAMAHSLTGEEAGEVRFERGAGWKAGLWGYLVSMCGDVLETVCAVVVSAQPVALKPHDSGSSAVHWRAALSLVPGWAQQ